MQIIILHWLQLKPTHTSYDIIVALKVWLEACVFVISLQVNDWFGTTFAGGCCVVYFCSWWTFVLHDCPEPDLQVEEYLTIVTNIEALINTLHPTCRSEHSTSRPRDSFQTALIELKSGTCEHLWLAVTSFTILIVTSACITV